VYRETNPPMSVPGLVTIGEYEYAVGRIPDGLRQRKIHLQIPLSGLGETGGGHFDCSDRKAEFLALYIKKVGEHRINADGSLRTIDPTKEGWLVDRWRGDEPAKAPPAPVGQYTGNPAEAYWYFDEELARAADAFQGYQRNHNSQLVGYVQDGKLLDPTPGYHFGVRIPWRPLDDGVSFRLAGAFRDRAPGQPDGPLVPHAADASQISIRRICGPAVQTGPDTWSVRYYRMGMTNKKRTRDICFIVSHPGDDTYKQGLQQSVLTIPARNNDGAEQHITFPAIADQPADVKTVALAAKSDANVPVYYYVRDQSLLRRHRCRRWCHAEQDRWFSDR
jgi:hypothetical protein